MLTVWQQLHGRAYSSNYGGDLHVTNGDGVRSFNLQQSKGFDPGAKKNKKWTKNLVHPLKKESTLKIINGSSIIGSLFNDAADLTGKNRKRKIAAAGW